MAYIVQISEQLVYLLQQFIVGLGWYQQRISIMSKIVYDWYRDTGQHNLVLHQHIKQKFKYHIKNKLNF